MPKMPDSEAKEESAESREEKKEQVVILLWNDSTSKSWL